MTAEESPSYQSLVRRAMAYSMPRNRELCKILLRRGASGFFRAQVMGDEMSLWTSKTLLARAGFQVIGHRERFTAIWRWSWADAAVDKVRTKDAEIVRRYGEANSVRELTAAELFITDGYLPTDLVAIAAMLSSGDASLPFPHNTWPDPAPLLGIQLDEAWEYVVLHGITRVPEASD